MDGLPSYSELLKRADAPAGSSWGLFGADDEIGTLNFLTEARARDAAALVKRGAAFNLDCPLDAFVPALFRHRQPPRHLMFGRTPNHRDDYVDGFYLQASSQIDGLRHFRHPDHGFYNRAADDAIKPGSPTIGVNRMAERGIVGRGVLIDIDRYLRASGRRLDHRRGEGFPAGLLDDVAAAQRVAFRPGDILLMRTGWLDFYRHEMSVDERNLFPAEPRCPGLDQSHDTLAWLWDRRIALGASDNLAFEAYPAKSDSPFVPTAARDPGFNGAHNGMMHPWLIALLGFVIGELWDLETLAADCAATKTYDCLVVAKPLNLIGGVGSPANATAIK